MSKTPRIALSGKIRSGKDSAGKHLYVDHDLERMAFGDALKRLYHETFPWVPRDPKPRAGYQTYGQVIRQQFGEDTWIKHVEQSMHFYENKRDVAGIVITDLRQPNEYEWCRANGFAVIRVTAPDELRMARAVEAGDDFTVHDFVHSTELYVDSFDCDYEIVNDGTIAELYAQVDEIVAKLKRNELGSHSAVIPPSGAS
jgi:dephospho-CoA kinase